MNRPNLLLIVTDQQRHDALGCASSWVRTPCLDRIASEGVRFSQCVTTTPVCVPARRSLATGRYPHATGVWNNGPHTMPEKAGTWMRAIRDAGYRTSLFGKTHLHPHQGDLRDRLHLMHAYGWDDVDETGGPRANARLGSNLTDRWQAAGLWDAYRADYDERFSTGPAWMVRPTPVGLEHYYDVYVGDVTTRYLETYEHDQPWLCCMQFPGPHEPWDTPEPYASLYDPAAMPTPSLRPDWPGLDALDRPAGLLDHRLAADPGSVPVDDALRCRADYAGNVTLIDDQIARVIDVIERRGELDRTAIVVTSDHGELNGDWGWIYKSCFLDSAVRVPMIVRPATEGGSNFARGAVSDALVEWFDAGATLVELAGAEWEAPHAARSLMPMLNDPKAAGRSIALSEYRGEFMVMDHDWKLLFNDQGQPYALFDRQADPQEQTNRVNDPDTADVVDRLRGQALERIMSTQHAAG